MVKIKEEFLCSKCRTFLGQKQNNWIFYPNPIKCPNCGVDNTKKFFEWIVNQRNINGK